MFSRVIHKVQPFFSRAVVHTVFSFFSDIHKVQCFLFIEPYTKYSMFFFSAVHKVHCLREGVQFQERGKLLRFTPGMYRVYRV